ncbi:inner kinetochore subunit cnp20-like isoform X2 [Haliotis rubra]|uniref:inner kinetochore subunit cnp20-like isoform X2 n=1 Tax=Haliotis rubra TaxID=36100 RepID=UPI001EE60E97|nr:inner kinetochore subunit cnp20-like isoform X2 [Haliotis rubra]
MSSKHTPRNLIQQYADNVATEKSTHPTRKRRPVSQSPTYGSSSKSASASKRQRTATEEDLTPRHLIQGFIDTQDTAVPSTRKSKRVGELPPPSSTKVKKSRRRSSLGIPSMDKVVNEFTPRTMIKGFLDQGLEQTPEVRVAKGDKSVARSSVGDLPNNEVSFQPIEASFHENKLTKQARKSRGGRQRLPINIVRRRSEKLAKQQQTGKELEFSSEEEEEYSAEEQTMEIGREANRSRRKSAHRSLHDVSDTSAKDDTSASESPRKSLSHSRVTPSKRQSMASLKNVSGVTPSKSLSMSRADAHLSPDSSVKTRTPKETRSPRRGTPRSNRRSGSMSVSPRSTVSDYKVKSAHAMEQGGGDMIADVEEDVDSEGSSVIREKSASKSKSRIDDDEELGSDHEQSQNKSKSRRDSLLDSTSSRHDEGSRPDSRANLSRSRSRSRVEDQGHSSPSRGDSRLGSEKKSRLSVKDRPSPKSRSMSKSKLAEGSDNEDEDKGDRGPSVRDDLSDQEDESHSAREHQHTGNYSEEEQSDDDDDSFHGEPEESIIPAADGETREYYTPLRTPHLKKKLSSRKRLPVVTSTPKPPSVQQGEKAAKQKGRKKSAQQKKLSNSYMPTSVVKGLFSHFCPAKVSKDAIAEVEKASAQFWENAAKDLESYALHAHRKTIEESDVELLMKRQKFVTPKESLYCLVEKYLPLELRQEIIPISRSGNKIELK